MPSSRNRYHRQYLQSVSYLAFTDARANELFAANRKDGQGARLIGDGEMGEQADDPLAPARGIFNGLRISLLLWGFIALVGLLVV